MVDGAPSRRLDVRVDGLVQGVFFRASTREEARRLGLRGYVRNLPDGSVEASFEGDDAALGRMLAWCGHGPPGARVLRLESRWGPATGEYAGFEVRR